MHVPLNQIGNFLILKMVKVFANFLTQALLLFLVWRGRYQYLLMTVHCILEICLCLFPILFMVMCMDCMTVNCVVKSENISYVYLSHDMHYVKRVCWYMSGSCCWLKTLQQDKPLPHFEDFWIFNFFLHTGMHKIQYSDLAAVADWRHFISQWVVKRAQRECLFHLWHEDNR
jgi:hypothetical protein